MAQLTDVQFVAIVSLAFSRAYKKHVRDSPVVINGLDNKPQRRTDTIHILIHDLFDNSGLSSIVQTPTPHQHCPQKALERLTASESASPCLLDAPYGESTTSRDFDFSCRYRQEEGRA